MAATTPEKLLTYSEVSQYLRRSPNTLRQDVMARRIPHVKIGHQVRFKMSEIDEWLNQKSIPAGQK